MSLEEIRNDMLRRVNEKRDEIESLKVRRDDLRNQIQALQVNLDYLNSLEDNEMTEVIENYNNELEIKQNELTEIENKIKEKNAELSSLVEQLNVIQKKIEE